jgi:hypothetical protein
MVTGIAAAASLRKPRRKGNCFKSRQNISTLTVRAFVAFDGRA